MQSDLESVIGNGARKLAQDLLGQKNLGVSVAYGYVSCVNDDGTIDVEVEDDEFASLPATTACMGPNRATGALSRHTPISRR